MNPSPPDDPIDGFTLQLLRSGDILFGLVGDLAEAIPPDAYPGETPADAVMQMISGTIRTFLDTADADEVGRATELMAGAVERVSEHLRLAVALRRRMDGGEAGRPGDGSPPVERVTGGAPGGVGAETAGPIDRAGPGDVLDDLAAGLLECGGLLSQLIAGMVEYDACGHSPADAVPIPELAHTLVRDALFDVRERHSERDLALAAQVVREAADGIANGIFTVDPEWN